MLWLDKFCRGSIVMCTPGVYLFVIRDSFGDGVCCDTGNGGFTLALDGKEIHNGDGEFKNLTAVIIKVDMDPMVRSVSPDTDVPEVRSFALT